MEIRYLTHSEIDQPLWDRCISKAVNGNVYGWSWYLNMMSSEWDALISGDYETVFPLPFRKRAGIYYIYQPFFTQQLGIYSVKPLSPEIVNHFILAIPSRFRYIELNFNSFNKIESTGLQFRNNLNHELDLIEPYEEIRRRYNDNLKRNIGKAVKENISINANLQPEDIIKLFRQNKGREFKHLGEYDYRKLQRMVYQCTAQNKAICYGAYTADNSLCAGAIMLFSHRKATFLFSATNETARKTGAMSFLIDRFIQDSAGNHLTLDFEGSNNENLARFYRSFGAKVLTYPALVINRLPFPVNILFYLKRRFL